MDNPRPPANLKYPKDILRECNYYVDYNFDGENQAVMNLSWAKDGVFAIKWNEELSQLCITGLNTCVNCPGYSAPIFAKYWVKKICKRYKFPYEWINFKLSGNPTTLFYFDVSEDTIEKTQDLADLFDSVLSEGLSAEHFYLAKEFNIEDGFVPLIEHYLGVKIDVKRNS